jgi:carbon monoxide dehydrogenase subunit G
MIEIRERVEVPAAPHVVWRLLSDPRAVAECVPGATLGDEREDGSFDGTLVVKFGPARVTFRAGVALELDAAAMAGHVTAKGKDKQGGTRVHAEMNFRVAKRDDAPGSVILIESQVEVFGRLASVVEGGAKFVVKRMTGEFSERLAARCASTSTV